MTSITLVTESKLYLKDNIPLYTYFDDYSKLFGFLVRRCVHHLRHRLNGESESRYRTKLMLNLTLQTVWRKQSCEPLKTNWSC